MSNVNDAQCKSGPEMPKYRCHKVVHALKIGFIELDSDKARTENRETDHSAVIFPVDVSYPPFKVAGSYIYKHQPKVGGYYVVYEDGYISYSPAEVFEQGYTRI